MSTRLVRAAFAVLLVAFASGCGKQETNAPLAALSASSPDATVRKSADLLKQGDVAGLLQNALPPADYEKLKTDWGKAADEKPITDEDRQKFQETMARLTAPDADKAIYAEIEPQLKDFDAKYQQQLPMYVAMGTGWLTGMVQQNKDLSEGDKQQAVAAINAVAAWVQKTRFTDPESVKKVLAIATRTARDLNLKTLDEARALNFDQSMQKARVALLGFKEALTVYGFSVDQTLDSIKPEVVANDGKTATVKVNYTLLGTPLSASSQMINVDGRWYGKDTIDKIKEHQQEVAAKTDAPPPPAPAEPAKN
ncbi:MAG TPA: hypothetical protein VGO25_02670 [Rhodanobacteraceae bacterium]|jgi:hypothetical protein|nr:hypothetical protein [Rhodanobacteraceae bacterium]